MNHLSIVHQNLSESHLPEPRKNPTGEVTHEELDLMVENNREAALMGIQPKAPRRAAELCFEKVDTHFGAVSALLGNDQVFECVKRTLHGIKKNGGAEQEIKAVAVTLAALEGGQAMDADSKEWPTAVSQVLRERSKSRDKYWIDKGEKFRAIYKYGSLVSGPALILCKPFVFPDPEKLKKPFKFPIELEERSVHELHFVQAFLDHPKSILKKLSAIDLSTIDFAQLEANSLKALKGRAHSVVHVVPENLGKLLARLSSRVPKGGQLDLRGQCCRWGIFDNAHDVVVRMSKKSPDDPMVKVSVYMPYMVVGDTPHMKVLPEELSELSFRDFDISGTSALEDVDTLCLDVGDRELAQALAGQFVPNEPDLKISGVLHALTWGGVDEMRLAAAELNVEGFQGLNSVAKELGIAVALAIEFDNIEVLKALTWSPLLEKLDTETLKAMVWARCGGESGFSSAIRSGRVEAVAAMGDLLARVSDLMRKRGISPDHFCRDVLLLDYNAASHLAKAPDSVVTAYAEAINRCYSFSREGRSVYARGFLMEQKLPVMRLLLKGMYQSSYRSKLLLEDIQSLLTSLLQTQQVKRVRAALELVIAIQTGGGKKLESCDAWEVLQGIRHACEQRYKFLCCGRVYSDNYKLAIKAEPKLHQLFQEAEWLLK